MSKTAHRIYLFALSVIVIIALAAFVYKGFSYYRISLEESFFHPDHTTLEPSGFIGHGFGIVGSFY